MDLEAAKVIGAGLAAIGVGVAATGVGNVFGAAQSCSSRRPAGPPVHRLRGCRIARPDRVRGRHDHSVRRLSFRYVVPAKAGTSVG